MIVCLHNSALRLLLPAAHKSCRGFKRDRKPPVTTAFFSKTALLVFSNTYLKTLLPPKFLSS